MTDTSFPDGRSAHGRGSGPAPVTVLGLGLMGRALAATFLRNGHSTTVWNRTPGRARQLTDQGARLAASGSEAVAAGPLVIVCVSGHQAVREVLEPLGGHLSGRVVVDLSSGSSAQARQTARWVYQQGASHISGAITAVPDGIGTPDASILYSGPRAAFARHEPTLRELGTAIYLGEDRGLAALHDVALVGVMWGVMNAFLHGAALLRTAGVDATAFAELTRQGIGTVADWLPGYARQVDDGAYPVLDATIGTQVAVMGHLIEESEAAGVSAELPRFVRALAERAVADGHGDSGYAAIVEQFHGAEPTGT